MDHHKNSGLPVSNGPAGLLWPFYAVPKESDPNFLFLEPLAKVYI
jgi:hypothetical protein